MKIAKVKKWLYRFRVPVLIGTGIIFSGICALIFTKGVVNDEIKIKSEYFYGEKLEYKSSAFLSNVNYEFKAYGTEEWTENVPRKIGKYYLRSKGSNIFGDYYYGKPQEFEIKKLNINVSISDKKYKYGTQPRITTNVTLPYSDSIDQNFTYDFQFTGEDTVEIIPYTTSIKIHNASSEEVTDCYKIVFENQQLGINKIPVSISLGNNILDYDGKEHFYTEYAIKSGEFLDGDTFVILKNPYKKAGEYDLNPEYTITNKNRKDVSFFYDVDFIDSSLVINKKPIKLESTNLNFIYDGTNHKLSSENISIKEGGLCENHTISYSFEDSQRVRVGEYENTFEARIYDEYQKDITQNYDISYDFGKLTISPQKLVLESGSLKTAYNKEEHNNDSIIILDGKLVDKDKIVVDKMISFIDAGEYENTYSAKIVDSKTNEDFTDCYDLECNFGNITIDKAKLEITIDKLEVTYDGLEHKNEYYISKGNLVGDDELVLKNELIATDAGTYSNTDFEIDIIDENDESNLRNYDVAFNGIENCLVINKRPITVHFDSVTKTYDGNPMFEDKCLSDNEYSITQGELADDEFIKVLIKTNPVNAGSYEIEREIKIYHKIDELDVTDNYDITIDEGNYQIEKAVVEITSIDAYREYDGTTDVNQDTFEISMDEKFANFSVEGIKATVESKLPGVYDYIFDLNEFKVIDELGNDVTENFDIELVNEASYTIYKRVINISMHGGFKVYDGTPLVVDTYDCDHILSSDHLEFENLPSVTHVNEGQIENLPEKTFVIDSEGNDVTDCYTILFNKNGKIYINPRPITLQSSSHETTFNNEILNVGTVTLAEGSMVGEEYFEVTSIDSTTLIHAGEYTNYFCVNIYNYEGKINSSDYDITFDFGNVVINPFIVELCVYETHIEYDGTEHEFTYTVNNITDSSDDIFYENEEILEGFTFNVSLTATGTEAGKEGLSVSGTFNVLYNSNPYNYSSDFDFSYDEQFLNIDKRTIFIQSLSGSKHFDGEEFPNTVWISYGSLADGHTIEYENVEGLVYPVTNAENPIGKPTIFDATGADVTDNYNIILIPGRVTIYAA
mgnify:CR=1 FL=1